MEAFSGARPPGGDGAGDATTPAALIPELDFRSTQFDARRALHTDDLPLPFPGIKILDNIGRCRLLLPQEVEGSILGLPIRSTSQEQREKHLAIKAAAVRRQQAIDDLRHRPREESTLCTMMDRLRSGPTAMLTAALDRNARVRVLTRHGRGVRGAATGTLVAFDRYLNLVLRDADEEYTIRTQVLRERPPAPVSLFVEEGGQEYDSVLFKEPAERYKWRPKQERRTRKLKQVFLRGDNVVLVSCIPPAAST